MTADDWKAYGDKLNRVGATLKAEGLRIAHHNHNLEFVKVGDTTGFDLIVTHTDPALVWFEIDVGWVAAAGHDPVALLRRYPGRFRMMHMKDIKPATVPTSVQAGAPIPGPASSTAEAAARREGGRSYRRSCRGGSAVRDDADRRRSPQPSLSVEPGGRRTASEEDLLRDGSRAGDRAEHRRGVPRRGRQRHRRRPRGHRHPGDERPTTIRLDVTSEDAVAAAARAHVGTDVLVNAVGWVAEGPILACRAEDFDRSMAVNVRSMMLTIGAFLPAMIGRGSGAIVNIASVVSSVMAAPNRFAYATSKAAVIGLTKSVARDYVSCGIRCNAVSPGTTDTPSLQDRFAASGDADAARAAFVARQPMNRLGRPDEIAAIAVLLASDEAPFMTGANIIVDGGMSL